MTSLRSLVRRGDAGTLSPLARRIAVVLAVITPLLIAGVAVSALQGPTGSEAGAPAPVGTASASPSPTPTSPAGTVSTVVAEDPLLPAAVVNLDTSVDVTAADGTTSPALIGKLLTTDLADGTSGQGFSWTVTDADTASAGLASGEFAAVVTIPSDFTSSYLSISSSDPVQATLEVQTNGANSYATELLASALSTDLQNAVANQATSGFVTNTLSAFGELRTQLGDAQTGATQIAGYIDQSAGGANDLGAGLTKAIDEGATPLTSGAQDLAGGLDKIVLGTADLPTYAKGVADASAGITDGLGVLTSVLAAETDASYAIDARQQALEASIAALRAEVPSLEPDAVQARLDALQLEAAGIRVSSFEVTLGLGVDGLGVTALQGFSSQLSGAQAKFAEDIPALTTGLADAANGATKLAGGLSTFTVALGGAAKGATDLGTALQGIAGGQRQLADGLGKAVTALPDYTEAQQQQIATVVTTPIVTEQSDVNALPSPAAAIAAVAVPLALWLGAFAIYLVLAPFTRRALDSTASTFRVVVAALAPAAILGVVQAAVVGAVLFAVGAQPAHLAGSILFSLLMSLVFVTLHQGLVALLGQAGRLLSLALVVVQLAAAAVIVPNGLSSPFYTGLSSVLPLTHAIQGMQALIGGGSLEVVGQAAAVLVVFGLIGFVLSLVAVSRRRSQNVVLVSPPSPAALDARGGQAAIAAG
ncbi:MAG: YhgE/Pip family protein [Herbiconiux sp.]|nr:YhgE/Pip family protein [Herbiconiux sp.]